MKGHLVEFFKPKAMRSIGTYPLPHMFDLRPHNATLRVLVSHPVLSAAVDHTAVDTLQHKAEKKA